MLLELNDVNKHFGKKLVVENLNVSMDVGEVLALIGPNGAGKSTTMKMICGLVPPDSGEIRILGKSIRENREWVLERLSAAIEEPALYPQFSGRQNLEMFAYIRNLPESRVREVETFIGIGDDIQKKVKTYSMGMKQRLMLGLCILTKPQLLILDEPANGLDVDGMIRLRREVHEIAEQGCGVLISSHNLSELQKVANRFVFLKDGKIVKDVKGVPDAELEDIYRGIYQIAEGENQ